MATPIRRAKPKVETMALRPFPSPELMDNLNLTLRFQPSKELLTWARATFFDEASPLYNEEHKHLTDASIGFLWTSVPNTRQMNSVVATAEIPMFRCSTWQKARQEQQLHEWFGVLPEFVITINADFAMQASDALFCAVVEHELYHCGQKLDGFGQPKFFSSGRPQYALKGHDVEEFVGVVRRYGIGNGAGKTAQLVEAALHAPLIADVDISVVCGTCGLKAA